MTLNNDDTMFARMHMFWFQVASGELHQGVGEIVLCVASEDLYLDTVTKGEKVFIALPVDVSVVYSQELLADFGLRTSHSYNSFLLERTNCAVPCVADASAALEAASVTRVTAMLARCMAGVRAASLTW